MKREKQMANAIALVQAKRKALNLPVSNVPTKVTDTTLYLAVEITGKSNIVKLTNDDLRKAIGITNFDGNKLADGRDFIMDSIKVQGFTGDSVDKVEKVFWNESAFVGGNRIPELLNAELQLKQGEKMLFSSPVADLMLSNDDDNYRDIASTPYLSAKDPIHWVLEFPEGVTVTPPAAGYRQFIRISCRGIQAVQ